MNQSGAPRPKTNHVPMLLVGLANIGLLSLLCLIVLGGLAYLHGYSLPPIFATATHTATETPLPTPTPTSTFTPVPSLTPSATSTPTQTSTPTATIIFSTPTSLPTRTKTPTASPTKTNTPRPTKTPSAVTFPDTHYGITYSGWIGRADNKAYGKGMRCASRKNEALAFEIPKNTSSLNLRFYRGPNQGKAQIILDGAVVETLDLYKKSPQYRYNWSFRIPNPKQPHEAKIVVLREKRNASTGYQVCFDAFILNSAPVDDASYEIRYGAWNGAENRNALGGGYRIAALANSTLTFQIQGGIFEWITARGPNYGQADIYVDDFLVMAVDLYSPAQRWREIIRLQNLGNGRHTVKIVARGRHSPASGGSGIVFDGFRIP